MATDLEAAKEHWENCLEEPNGSQPEMVELIAAVGNILAHLEQTLAGDGPTSSAPADAGTAAKPSALSTATLAVPMVSPLGTQWPSLAAAISAYFNSRGRTLPVMDSSWLNGQTLQLILRWPTGFGLNEDGSPGVVDHEQD